MIKLPSPVRLPLSSVLRIVRFNVSSFFDWGVIAAFQAFLAESAHRLYSVFNAPFPPFPGGLSLRQFGFRARVRNRPGSTREPQGSSFRALRHFRFYREFSKGNRCST